VAGLSRQIVIPFYFPWQITKNSFCLDGGDTGLQKTMIDFVKRHIIPGSTVYTDGLKGFEDLKAADVCASPKISKCLSG
jgi:hypothetical protein